MAYYMCESLNSFKSRKAEPLKARNLASAKREASRKQAFEGTVLFIGTSLNNGFLESAEVAKFGKAWIDVVPTERVGL